jgi:hypothetical protein
MKRSSPIHRLLLENVQPRPGRRGWHGGATPIGALKGVSAAQASWRPAPGRLTIWELTLHIAYWKYAVRRRLEGADGPRFPRSPANFPKPPDPPTERAWKSDRRLLADEHEQLLDAIASVPVAHLDRRPPGARKWTSGELIVGIAQHDAYHTGQIQLIKRLWRERKRLSRA